MARQRKSKIFELLSSDFKVTDFYKPTGTEGDMHYYVTIDDLIRLRMQVVNRVVVIDGAETITTTYIKPIYEKLIKTIMSQQELTVLVSLLGHTYVMQQACIACGAPIVDDERYITVARSYYNKMKKKYNGDNSKYGFYILSVSDDDMKDDPAESSSVNQTPIGIEPPISKVTKLLLTNLKPVFPDVKTESASTDSIRCYLGNGVDFVVEVVNGDIYIKDLLQTSSAATLNLVKILDLISVLEKLTTIQPDVYILSIQNSDLNGICAAKGYENIPESRNLPLNHLFKQAFFGYGTYHIKS